MRFLDKILGGLFTRLDYLSGIVTGLRGMAERQGFEPWVPRKVQRISNPSRSTAPAPLQGAHSLRPGVKDDKLSWFTRGALSAIALLSVSSCSEHGLTRLEQVQQSGELVVLTRISPTTYYEGADGYTGIEYDMTRAFAENLGVKLRMIVPQHFEDIFTLLKEGKADMAAAGLTVTKERSKLVKFAPPYQRINQQLLYRQGTVRPRSVADIVGEEIMVTAGTSYADRLAELKRRYKHLAWKESRELDTEELIQRVAEGTLTFTIADSNIVAANRPLFPDLRMAFDIQRKESLAWAFPISEDTSLYDEAVKFQRHLKRTGEIKVLLERYYGATDADYFNMTLYQLRVQNILPSYRHLFEEAGRKYGIDWRLLAAIAYQESYWNPRATSPTGVRGLMMLTQVTASQLGVTDRLNPAQSVDGGARYIRQIIDRLPEEVTEPDRTWMALASYNVGYFHLTDALDITRHRGGNPNKWKDVKQSLPLLARPSVYKNLKYGYARGTEPVRYVSRIRRYYDVLLKLDKKIQEKIRNEAIGLTAPAI
jgi:membrane-bound lytic murein transglycosylase F